MLCTVSKLQRWASNPQLIALHPGMIEVLHVCCRAHALPAGLKSRFSAAQDLQQALLLTD